MKNLSKLAPAETLLILYDSKATLKELLKVTFMDLLLKKVLKTVEVSRQTHSRDNLRVYKYVVIGKNFYRNQPRPHEEVFLKPFIENIDSEILFRHCVKIGYENAKSKTGYQSHLIKYFAIDGLFTRSFFERIFGGVILNDNGKLLKTKLETEIEQLENELPEHLLHDKPNALEILKLIGGNVFLLKNIDFTLFQQIDKDLLSEINKDKTNKKDGSGCSGCGLTWSEYDGNSQSFDSSCSGDGGSDGGSVGCSGCGGCGGCGGCS